VNDLRRNINPNSIGAAISPVIVNANKQDSDANILANPRIRARNHEKAKILIGERVPNITTTSTATGFISESITYLDVGLKLDVEPTVYLNNDVAIKIGLEVSNIVGQQQTKSGTSAYQIGTRTASTVLRLKDGETQILAGLINDEDRSNANKLPGFGDIPLLGRLFGNTNDNRLKTEIILSITPRLIRNIVRPSANAMEFKAGTETTFRVSPEILAPANSGTVTEAVPSTNTPDYTKSNQSTENNSTYSQNNISNGSGVIGGVPTASFAQLQWQGPVSVKKGDSVSLQLIMQSEQPVSAIPMTIGFDPKLIQIINLVEGNF
jgi:general secretion pathway protein D